MWQQYKIQRIALVNTGIKRENAVAEKYEKHWQKRHESKTRFWKKILNFKC